MATIQRIESKKNWKILSCKADNCVSILMYSVREYKDNSCNETSKLFQDFFRKFSYLQP